MILHGDEVVRPASVDKLNMRADRAIIMLQFPDVGQLTNWLVVELPHLNDFKIHYL